MSLRQRFVLLALVATLAIGAAVVSIAQLFARSDTAREQAARATADGMVSALGSRAVAAQVDPTALRAIASEIAAPQVDANAGFCSGQMVIAAAGPGPHHEPRHPELPPDQRDFVSTQCAAATAGAVRRGRLAHPHDVIVVSATRLTPELAAWGLVRVPTHPEEGPELPLGLGVMALATLALGILTAEATIALGRGTAALELALFRLRDDLRSELPVPRPKELAKIAEGLRSMALRLADAHDRELALQRDLSHEQRLAGLGRVTAGVAHEIRNPLAAIKLKLDGLLGRSLDERTHADARVCLAEVARLDEIIGAMLLVARKTPARPELLSFGEVTDERVGLLRELAEKRHVKLSREGEAKAVANRVTLTRALDNLLRNAIEASPEGGRVRVRLAAGDGKATLEVVDEGPGVPPERLAELFEPFFTTKPEGTGLGLWLSRSLLEIDSGSLAYGRKDDHTLFSVTLPAPTGTHDPDHPYR
jgi:signal transduction histidine kinase